MVIREYYVLIYR